MRITWIGNHAEGVIAFRKAVELNGVDAFITLDESAFAKRSAGSREYIDICKENSIDVYCVSTIKDDYAFNIISEQKPDLLVVLGWSEILPERLLHVPKIGTVGTHAALLPHNRGSAPINWALIHGEKKTGNTMMWLSKDVDAGTIIDQMEFSISLFDTSKTLYERVAETNAQMLIKLIKSLNNGIIPRFPVENITNEPILPRRKPKDGLIDWNQSTDQIYDFIRALTKPYPGAYTYLNKKKYLIWEASILPFAGKGIPGTIIGTGYGFADRGTGLCISTGDGALWVTAIEDDMGNEYTNQSLFNLDLKGTFQNE